MQLNKIPSDSRWSYRHLVLGLSLVLVSFGAAAFDEEEAKLLARQSGCFKCHGIDKKKDGPAYRDVAAKYRTDPQATAKLYRHLTAGVIVKFPNGNEEEHKVLSREDSGAIQNLIAWLLSL